MTDLIELATAALPEVVGDLQAEQHALESILEGLEPGDVDAATPAQGWTVRDTVAHLVQGEELAAMAITDPAGFKGLLEGLMSDLGETLADFEVWARSAAMTDLLERWSAARDKVRVGLEKLDARDKIPWVLGPMSAATFARARLMECWAHGLDVTDGLGILRSDTDERLRHVLYMGVRTHGFSFKVRGLDVPEPPFRLELTSPSGDTWTAGPATATEVVRGPAWDLAAVVTQRRNPADTSLVANGAGVQQWLAVAQCFAGPPTENRPPGTFVAGRWQR